MTTYTTGRPINLNQLHTETGWLFQMEDDGTTRTVRCETPDVTDAELQAAVDQHVAIDETANRTTLEERAAQALTANRTFLALPAPTNAQTMAQVKALTRQNQGLIRLALNRLEGLE